MLTSTYTNKEQQRNSILKQKTSNKKLNYIVLPEQKESLKIYSDDNCIQEEHIFDIEIPSSPTVKRKQSSSNNLAAASASLGNAEYFEVPLEAENVILEQQCYSTQFNSEVSRPSEPDAKPQSDVKEYNMFLLANPRSGSQKARHFLTKYAHLDNQIQADNGAKVQIRVFDVINQKHLIAGELRVAIENKTETQQVVVAIMGGDGSLGCFIESMKEFSFIIDNLESLIFVPLPFGTGNDLGRALGWGGSEGPWAKSLLALVNQIIVGEEDRLTLWEVEVHATTLGYKGKERVQVSDDSKKFKKLMCCYYNLGMDAEVSNSFERVRSGYRLMNYLSYAYLTMRGAVCTCDLIRVKNFVDNFTEIRPQGIDEQFKSKRQVVFKMEALKADPFMMVGVNIPSNYGGMGKENWHKNKKHCALPAELAEGRLQTQSYNDAKLEIMGVSSRQKLIIKKEFQNFGQVEGPFEVNFRADLHPTFAISLAIDGESFQLTEAKKMKFSQYKKQPALRIIRGPHARFLTTGEQ